MTYIVKPGDTLWGISNQYGVSVTELARINNKTASTLKVGDILTIPTNNSTNPDNMFIYTVKKGDSLYSIAKTYNTTVKDIIDINNLTNTNLSIGQKLRIPEKYNEEILEMPTFTNYTVKKGDSLYSISKLFNIDVNTIMKDNNLLTPIINIGQILKIRSKNTTILECFGEDYIELPQNNPILSSYTVKKGDSLYSIAKTFNTTVEAIKKNNNLNTNVLQIGQVLKV